jgi:hypothetical protein
MKRPKFALVALGLWCLLTAAGALHSQETKGPIPDDPLPGASGRVPPSVQQPPDAALAGPPTLAPVIPAGASDTSAAPVSPADRAAAQKPFGADAYATFGDISPFFTPAVGHSSFRADYRVTWFASEPVSGQSTNLGYVQHDFGMSFPIWQCSTDEWTAGLSARGEIFQTHAVLPNTLQPFPDELWNIRLFTSYRHEFDNGWIAGGTVSFGSASDKPFHSINEMTAGANAFLRVPQGEHNAWLFTLAYSPTSELPIPIPGVAYVWQPSADFRMNIGLPFQVMWRPTDDVTLDFSYMLLRTVHARATYRLAPALRVYVSYDWGNEGWFLAERSNNNDRFYYYDMRVSSGVQLFAARNFALDLAGGYVFNRFYFEGQHLSDSHFNRVDVGDGPFVSLQGRLRW